MDKIPLFTNDAVVLGVLMLSLGFIFYSSNLKSGFWSQFYKVVPAVLMCYLIPAIFNSLGIISDSSSSLYLVASRYFLPASLVLMTLSIDLKAIKNLGYKALVMFLTGTVGIVIGGPIAILLISLFSPETVGGAGPDAVWRGLSTLAGSWIGGGANQAAMLEIFKYNPAKYGGMVLVDIVIANLWLAIILLGIGKSDKIDKWLNADNTAIEDLKEKMSSYTKSVSRKPELKDYMIMLGIAFTAVGFSHWASEYISDFLISNFEIFNDKTSALSSFTSTFFWMITIATAFGVGLSFTKAKSYEGTGASQLGSVFIYFLVATIGMKMDLTTVFENPGLILIGIVWMSIHAGLLILVAKLIKAPYFFLAVGSQANVGGAASAPVVASAFHPSLTSVGVLLAVFGYIVGTYAAIGCTFLMKISSNL
ncbi:DUF819 family protein [Psychroflexus sp. MES1-P1E]|uniref:DUF819 family protein n=1 Tax=Psychroflexus sp. MES1-P1E TaxID=2058320 RepID=UPI000C7AA44F|nr:DUF819 family protein [Psychroflexus sp. MES1-P1E]PKG43938.1 hypothetical protein CXF67_02360 [Psychroflexus sp. MES1-P1E]